MNKQVKRSYGSQMKKAKIEIKAKNPVKNMNEQINKEKVRFQNLRLFIKNKSKD